MFLSTWLNWFFPISCVGCHAANTYCCDACLANLPPALIENENGSPVLALFDYQDPCVRRLIWLLKYRGARPVAKIFARALYDRLLETLAEREALFPAENAWLLVPIPLAPRRLRRRGFNQSLEIARHLIHFDSRSLALAEKILVRARDAAPQTSLKRRAERLANAQGIFRIAAPEKISGRRVIILDDVTTTEATLREAARVLRAAGARVVIPIAIAHD